MFDFAWSEILLIGAVALIAIGPKDMPAAIRTVATMIKKARRMAAEFQTHVDEMVREAELGDLKTTFRDIRNFDIAGAMERTIDPDRSIRKTFQDDPFKPTYPTASEVSTPEEAVVGAAPAELRLEEPRPEEPRAEPGAHATPPPSAPPPRPDAPDWLPPNLLPPAEAREAAEPPEAPAWIPPEAVLQRRRRA